MSAEPDPSVWPVSVEKIEKQDAPLIQGRIVHVRHRVGEYDVTRVVLEPLPSPEAKEFGKGI